MIDVHGEREVVARLLYRWYCESDPDWDGEWRDDYWDDLQIEEEREEWRRRAMQLIDAIVQLLIPAAETVKAPDRILSSYGCPHDTWVFRFPNGHPDQTVQICGRCGIDRDGVLSGEDNLSDAITFDAYRLTAEFRARDDRGPQQCLRCDEVCRYDGWDHVHVSGIGIGSCR